MYILFTYIYRCVIDLKMKESLNSIEDAIVRRYKRCDKSARIKKFYTGHAVSVSRINECFD